MKAQVRQIIDVLGAGNIEATLGVTPHSIRNARSTGMFPSGWFDTIDLMCRDAGIPCPRPAFNWRSSTLRPSSGASLLGRVLADNKGGHDAAPVQGGKA